VGARQEGEAGVSEKKKSEPVVISPGTGHSDFGPSGAHLRARDFLEAADLVRGKAERFTPVAAFLYCRSIELSLKAFLLATGDTVKDVKDFGHSLLRLLRKANVRGFDAFVAISAQEEGIIRSVNPDYVGQRLAYFDIFAIARVRRGQPGLAALATLAGKLLKAVEQCCHEPQTD
jgi:HEPN domain-containing protein